MLIESLIGHRPLRYRKTKTLRSIILSEAMTWSAFNFITPIFGIFIATTVKGGNIQTAGTTFSIYLISRVISTLISGEYLASSSSFKKALTYLIGIFFVTIAYIGLANSHIITQVFIYQAILGISLGVASPAKNSLFAENVDREKESFEYGIWDAAVFIGEALAAALGGFIANAYGFTTLFYLAAGINTLGAIIFFVYIKRG